MTGHPDTDVEAPASAATYNSVEFEDYLTGGVHEAAPLWTGGPSGRPQLPALKVHTT